MPQLPNPSCDDPNNTSNSPHDFDAQQVLAATGHATQESEFFNPSPPGYVKGRHKYIGIIGTVMSGLGKGIFSASLAKLLKDKGL
ncbi:MAG: hypothetical protein QF785_07605, partial [Phycisphaeraceae bacterium]|nr:hypothetical protein [Phycisphaeraceae bacterium]